MQQEPNTPWIIRATDFTHHPGQQINIIKISSKYIQKLKEFDFNLLLFSNKNLRGIVLTKVLILIGLTVLLKKKKHIAFMSLKTK